MTPVSKVMLDCAYCFYLEKEALYPGGRLRMRSEVARAYVRQVIEAHAGAPEVVLGWQGGEPTLMASPCWRSCAGTGSSTTCSAACMQPTRRIPVRCTAICVTSAARAPSG